MVGAWRLMFPPLGLAVQASAIGYVRLQASAISTVPARRVGISSPARNSEIKIGNLIEPLKANSMPFSEFSYLYFS
jgi:hypothetical protein